MVLINRIKSTYEHFRKLALETERYLYYINTQGYFERVDKRKMSNSKRTKVEDYKFEKMIRTISHGKSKTPILVSRIQRKQYSIKATIIRIIKNYDYDFNTEVIIHKDKDYTNCSIENLEVVKRHKLPNGNDIMWRIKMNDKEQVFSNSRELCKKLGVKKQTVDNYLKGIYTKKHWLNDIEIERLD